MSRAPEQVVSDMHLLIFKSICMFVKDLNTEFGSTRMEIKLYNHLLEKTDIVNAVPIQKHIDAFVKFFEANREGVEAMDANLLREPNIVYSTKVFINVQSLVRGSHSTEVNAVIWKHLLYIWNKIDPSSQARRILKENGGGDRESQFLENMLDKVSSVVGAQNIQESQNPMSVAMGLMSSGVFQELLSGMTSDNSGAPLDMGKMFNSVQNLMTKMSPGGMIPPEISGMINMIGAQFPPQSQLQRPPVEPIEPATPGKIEEIDE